MGKFISFIAGAFVGIVIKEAMVSVLVHNTRKGDEQSKKVIDQYDFAGTIIENALTPNNSKE